MVENEQLKLAFGYVNHTNKNIFLTGKAGTGKTTFLQQLKKTSPKRMVVVAPTGVAAINAGGVTIHSFFNLPFGPYLPENNSAIKRTFNKEKINLILSLDLLIIDEISMVRADTLDSIDEILRRYKNHNKPFGGVQLLMIGDLHQLSPVIKDEEWRILQDYYQNIYFFSSIALQKAAPVTIELKHIYRQNDQFFIDLLNSVRENKMDKSVLDKLNERYIPDFTPKDDEGYITLTTHNNTAQEINDKKLLTLESKSFFFKAVITGEFDERVYPTPVDLELKINSQVMFVKNDPSKERLFFNGKIGRITGIKEDLIYVKCQKEEEEIAVAQLEWTNIKYTLNNETKLVEETIAGSFVQYPLKLAWAITIHKSQGLTFEKAIIDANMAFAFGQVYVALSRCKSLEGMVLRSPLGSGSIKKSNVISDFTDNTDKNPPCESELIASKIAYQQSLLLDLIDFSKIKRASLYIQKVVKDAYTSFLPALITELNELHYNCEKRIYSVSITFKKQLESIFNDDILPGDDMTLQERVKKGATYFSSGLDEIIIATYPKLEAGVDNKALQKNYYDALNVLKKETYIKSAILKKCINGFDSLEYLQTIADAEINYVQNTTVINQSPAKYQNIPHDQLYNSLIEWRNKLANDQNVPVYIVLTQKSILEITNKFPSNLKELETIKGIGKAKIKQYGEEILQMIETYCKANHIERSEFKVLEDIKKETKKDKKTDTKIISYNLFREGKTILAIAQERGFTTETIRGHLAYYVSIGEITITELVNEEKIKIISDYLQKNQNQTTKEIKDALGDDVGYSDIKAVISYMEFLKKRLE